MKFHLSNQLVYKNINHIYQSPNECVTTNDFIDLEGKPLINSDLLIAYMVENDLIETENDPRVYYLTPYGYDVQEQGSWYDFRLDDNREDHQKDRGLAYSMITPEEELGNKKQLISKNLGGLLIILGLITFFTLYFNGFFHQSITPNFQIKFLDQIQEIIDSLGQN